MKSTLTTSDSRNKSGARVAFLGNSILFFNDCPRMFANLAGNDAVRYQDSCLRGGTNLSQLWERGNGMMFGGFRTEAAKRGRNEYGTDVYDVGAATVKQLLQPGEPWHYDYVVLNDHTQGPAREATRKLTQKVLAEKYLPLIRQNSAIPVIIETAAYRYPNIMNSRDLGETREFQQKVKEGVDSYAQILRAKLPPSCEPRVCPVGAAFLRVHDDNEPLWEDLFDTHDHFHPSPVGTFLQACVLHYTLFGRGPKLPETDGEIRALWKDARVMHTYKGEKARRLPTVEEAKYLCEVASVVVQK